MRMQNDNILTQKYQCGPLPPLPYPHLVKKIVRPDLNGLLIGPSDRPYMVRH
jgi:hypothetical protein